MKRNSLEFKIYKREYDKIYYAKNKNRIRIRNRKYMKQYCLKNRERIRKYRQEYYRKNKEKIFQYARDYSRLPEVKQRRITKYGKEYYRKIREQYCEQYNNARKIKRHNLGISKKYNSDLGISYTKEYRRLQRQKRKALMKGGGNLSIRQIQIVYEDNIKKYGTLTCYLCLNPILFGKDHLEHKIPLSRGGMNEYSNLAIACQGCNCKKNNKTEEEYRKEFCYHG